MERSRLEKKGTEGKLIARRQNPRNIPAKEELSASTYGFSQEQSAAKIATSKPHLSRENERRQRIKTRPSYPFGIWAEIRAAQSTALANHARKEALKKSLILISVSSSHGKKVKQVRRRKREPEPDATSGADGMKRKRKCSDKKDAKFTRHRFFEGRQTLEKPTGRMTDRLKRRK